MKKHIVIAVSVLTVFLTIAAILHFVDRDPWLYFHIRVSAFTAGVGIIAACVAIACGYVTAKRRARLVQVTHSVREDERNHRRTFLRRLDHEIKNPVTAIRTALATMPGDSEAVRVATAQADRLSSLVNELAKLADLETRQLDTVSVDLKEIVDEAAAAMLTTYPGRTINVEFPQVPWPVPNVSGDPDLLVVALYNVLANAAKYSEADTPIEVRAGEVDGWVTLDVSDSGWGIPPEDIPIVWEELARGSNTRGAAGSGLGLAIVRVIAERHGGSALLRSQVGKGTRVSIRLRSATSVPH